MPDSAKNLWDAPNVLVAKMAMAEEFVITTKFSFTPNPKLENEKAGLVIMGLSYALILPFKEQERWYLARVWYLQRRVQGQS